MNITLRAAESSDISFAYEVKSEALGPHVALRWGWDEKLQSEIHARRWSEKNWFIISRDNEDIGTCAIDVSPEGVRFGEFYLIAREQRKGIGTFLLQQLLKEWDSKGYRVYLEYLKWNPVGSLYRRFGFEVLNETDNHYYMCRLPNAH